MKHIFGKYGILSAFCIFGAVFFCGCGRQETIRVNISDRQYETQLVSKAGRTVEELLGEAEITLNEGDVVEPELSETVRDDNAQIKIMRRARVTVLADGQETDVDLCGATVADALADAGVTLGAHDGTDHAGAAYLADGMDIRVTRRVEVSIRADGKTKAIVTEAATVGDVLSEQGIVLGKKDKLTPKASEKLTEGMAIAVSRVETRKETKYESIAFDTKTENSGSMYAGTSKVKQKGQNGKKKVTYEIRYVDGKEKSRKVVKEEVVTEPVAEIVVRGTKKKTAGASDSNIVSKEKVYDCDGSGHGYYVITYKDGSVKYVDF